MDIPTSIIDPAAADSDAGFIVALKDDDWDDWNNVREATVYYGARRATSNRWNLRDLTDHTPVRWAYADDEIVVLGSAAEAWPPDTRD